MFLAKQLVEFLKLLHSETATGQLAAGVVLGVFMGFTPIWTLHWFCFWILLLLFRINIGAACLSYATFKVLSFGLDPLFDRVGHWALIDVPSLRSTWVSFSQMEVIPFTRFNNTIVMGSFLVSLLAAIPVFLLSIVLIQKYRSVVVARIKTTWLWRTWSGTKLYNLYVKYESLKQ